jgi:cyclophilin family peptidyl-prolyl cis-trans isomerase
MQAMYQQYAAYYTDFTTYYPTVESFIQDNMTVDSRLVPEDVWKLYEKQGGNISLDGAWRAKGGHTVFGQVYAGQDVVDKIAAVEVGENDKPVKDVIIESAEIITVS